MSAMEIIKWLIGGFLTLTVLMESLSNTLKPWTWLLKRIGNIVNQPMIEKVDSLDKKLDQHIKDDQETSAKNSRARILAFAAESRRGHKHTEDQFNNVLEAIDEYETYCALHPEFKNNKGKTSMEYIKEMYAHCLENDSFLT